MRTYASQPQSSWKSSLGSDRSKRSTKVQSAYQTSPQKTTSAPPIQQKSKTVAEKPWGTITGNIAQSKTSTENSIAKTGEVVQRLSIREEEGQQQRATASTKTSPQQQMVQRVAVQCQRASNRTGLPNKLKSTAESKSGLDLSDVRVHYNSPKPERLDALAYTQGNQIFLGRGQEQHLPHELGHVVQQKQGRVKATTQFAGLKGNDNPGLEKEADQYAKEITQQKSASQQSPGRQASAQQEPIVQRLRKKKWRIPALNGGDMESFGVEGVTKDKEERWWYDFDPDDWLHLEEWAIETMVKDADKQDKNTSYLDQKTMYGKGEFTRFKYKEDESPSVEEFYLTPGHMSFTIVPRKTIKHVGDVLTMNTAARRLAKKFGCEEIREADVRHMCSHPEPLIGSHHHYFKPPGDHLENDEIEQIDFALLNAGLIKV